MRRIRESLSGEKGFTLVELLVVIGIIGILAMLLLPQFRGMRDRARIASCQSNLKNIGTTLEAFYADNERYPDSTTTEFADTVSEKLRACPHDKVNYTYMCVVAITPVSTGLAQMPTGSGTVVGGRIDSYVVFCTFHDGSAATEPEETQLYVTQDGVFRNASS